MYCPKCATQNSENAQFCRACGSDISLVPQALTGSLQTRAAGYDVEGQPYDSSGRRRRRGQGPPSFDKAIKSIISGIGFLVVALAIFFFTPAGRMWWWSMLFPAFGLLSSGVAEWMRAKQLPNQVNSSQPFVAAVPSAPRMNTFAASRNTGELVPPPASVTEGTTRHLGAEAPTRTLNANAENSNREA